MKKVLVAVFLGFLLSGCVSTPQDEANHSRWFVKQGTTIKQACFRFWNIYSDICKNPQRNFVHGDYKVLIVSNSEFLVFKYGTFVSRKRSREDVDDLLGIGKKASKIKLASMVDDAKNTCKKLDFKEGTEKFSDCALKLYSQSVELAAKNNQQVVMQPQSSGSNTVTIYDPRRDSRILMDKGMKMITGRCTLGYDC